MLPEGRCIALNRAVLENSVILGKLPPLSWEKNNGCGISGTNNVGN